MGSGNITSQLKTLAFQHIPLEAIVADIFIMIDYSRGEGTNTSAVECLLSFCIREYNAVVSNGQITTNEAIIDLISARKTTDEENRRFILDINAMF